MNWTNWVFIGCLLGALSVILGAFGAHGLKGRFGVYEMQIFETAVRYQMYHALALFGVALVASHVENSFVKFAGWSFCIGIILFSGSLYTLAGTGQKWLGAVAPLGGLFLIGGWLSLAWSVFSMKY